MGKHYDYLIVGAGLFGAVAACELNRQGKRCLVIDQREHIAGNCYTKEQEGIQIHLYGAHIFHTSSQEIWNYVNQFVAFKNFINSPIAVYRNELYNLPFNMNTFSKLWGISTPGEARSIIDSQIHELGIAEPKNLEEQALMLVGRDVYEKLIKGYTEKQWGRECSELPAFIIKRLPLRFTYDNNYFNDSYQGIPEGGYTLMISRMLAGIEVLTGREYKAFCEEAKKDKGTTWSKVIYTGMIDEYFDYRLGVLEYRSLAFEHKWMPDCDNYQGNAVVNYTEREVPYTRTIEHKHFTAGGGSGTVVTWEYPAKWEKGDEPYYPVNDEANNRLYKEYSKLAIEEEHVIFGGRLGQYQYYNMDQVIASALEAVKREKL